ncbi:MAG: FoF1 ATP synthase subunit gamma, partial [Fimbriimonadaceae bacterium]
MATLKQLRQRIRAAKSIQQITRAMKLVAAARLKKATDRALQARPYSEKLRDVMLSISESGELPSHPLLEKREGEDYCLLLVTGERGLCGSYNTNVIRKAADFLAATPGNPSIFAVGKKGMQFFSKRGYKIAHHYTLPSAGASYDDALKVARIARELFETNQVQKLYLCYSQFYSPIRQVPRVIQLLP